MQDDLVKPRLTWSFSPRTGGRNMSPWCMSPEPLFPGIDQTWWVDSKRECVRQLSGVCRPGLAGQR